MIIRCILLLLISSSIFAQSEDGYTLEIPEEYLSMERFKYGLKKIGTKIPCEDDRKTFIQIYELVYQIKSNSIKNFRYKENGIFVAGGRGSKVEVYLLQIGFREPLDLSSLIMMTGDKVSLMVSPSNFQEVQQPIINLFQDIFREKRKELEEGSEEDFGDIALIGYTSDKQRKNAENVLPKFLLWNNSKIDYIEK